MLDRIPENIKVEYTNQILKLQRQTQDIQDLFATHSQPDFKPPKKANNHLNFLRVSYRNPPNLSKAGILFAAVKASLS